MYTFSYQRKIIFCWHNEFQNSFVLMHVIDFTPPISTFVELFRSKVGRRIKRNGFLFYNRHAIHTHEVARQSQAI